MSNRVQMEGLSAVTAEVLLLILDAWGLVLELLCAYPETFSGEDLTTYTTRSASGLIVALLLLVAVEGLYARQSEAAEALLVALASSRSSSARGC